MSPDLVTEHLLVHSEMAVAAKVIVFVAVEREMATQILLIKHL